MFYIQNIECSQVSPLQTRVIPWRARLGSLLPTFNHVKLTNPLFLTVRVSIITRRVAELKHFELVF